MANKKISNMIKRLDGEFCRTISESMDLVTRQIEMDDLVKVLPDLIEKACLEFGVPSEKKERTIAKLHDFFKESFQDLSLEGLVDMDDVEKVMEYKLEQAYKLVCE